MTFVFIQCLKQFFWAQRNLGNIKKVCPECPSWLRVSTKVISLFYKLIFQDPQYANNNIATCPKYSSKNRHIGMFR